MKTFFTALLLSIFGFIHVQAQFEPDAGPFADNVAITGDLEVGAVLTGSYDYSDTDGIPEDGTAYKWYRADDEFGTGWTLIAGAEAETYTLVEADDGKYIAFEVTPSNGTDTGLPSESMLEGPIGGGGGTGNTAPSVSNVTVNGTLEVNEAVSASYTYTDPENDLEFGSTYVWYRSDDDQETNKTDISGEVGPTYSLTATDETKYISVEVTPSDGTDVGTAEESALAGPIQAASPSVTFAGGSGTEGDPYQIETLEQLQGMGDNLSSHFVLIGDIDASTTSTSNSGAGFIPIGTGASPFTGSFNGMGYVITDLTINRPSQDNVGLLGVVDAGAAIMNVRLEQVSITGQNSVGGLVGINSGAVTGSYTTGSVNGSADVGGLVGIHGLDTISKSYSNATVSGGDNAGGLVGYSTDNITTSFASGSVSGDTNVGGLIGDQSGGIVSNSFVIGASSGSTNVGGVVGIKYISAGDASNVFWDTEASGLTNATGDGSTTGMTGKTTTEMQTESTFTGWDFTDTWTIDAGVNEGYPIQQTFYEATVPVNNAPTGITLSSTEVGKSGANDAVVGALSTTDADEADSHTYSLVTGNGDTDNTSFNINGTEFRANDASAMTPGDYSVRIQTDDNNGGTYSEAVTITVIDDVPPTFTAIDSPIFLDPGASTTLDLHAIFEDESSNDGSLSFSYDTSPTVAIGSASMDMNGILTITAPSSSIIYDLNFTVSDEAGNETSTSFKIVSFTPFITTWSTTTANEAITLQTGSEGVSEYDFYVNWGDGSIEHITGADPDPTHQFADAGSHTISIYGQFPHLNNDPGFGIEYDQAIIDNMRKLTGINQWGDIAWESMENMFYEASNLTTYSATDTPDLSNASSLAGMFVFSGLGAADLSGWDVSTITNFNSMFANTDNFDGDLSGWVFSSEEYSTQNGVKFTAMFNGAASFTGTGLPGWDVSNSDKMDVMFSEASAFNQDLSGWDISNVADMFLLAEQTALSTENYNALLTAWSQLSVQSDVEISADPTTFTYAGKEGRDILTETYGWTITDGGLQLGTLALSSTETAPVDPNKVDTLWLDLKTDGQTVNDAFSPTWQLTGNAGLTTSGTPIYNETKEQWGYDLSQLDVADFNVDYTLDITATIATENGSSSVQDSYSTTINAENIAPEVTDAIGAVNVDEDADATTYDLTTIFSDTEQASGELTYSVETNTNSDLVTSSIDDATNTLTLTYIADQNGTAEITIRATDVGGLSADDAFTVTVNAVNDAPTITLGDDQTINEDAGAQTISEWATDIGPGAANESDQTLTSTVTTNNAGLFAKEPTVDVATGDLAYTAAADSFGTATVTVSLSDGSLTTEKTFTITVNAVNDAPTFVAGENQTVDEDAGEQTVTDWATEMNAGADNENDQTLSFAVTNNNNELFSVQPTVDATTGDLSYTPAANANGEATVTLSLNDNGGTDNGGDDSSTPQTFTITVNPVNDAPIIANAVDDFSVNEDASAGTINLTNIFSDEEDNSADLIYSVVSNSNTNLIDASIDNNTDELAILYQADQFGTADITIRAEDSEGLTVDDEFTVTVNPVNDAPIFTKGADQSVGENSGSQTVSNWATGISAGAENESEQELTFNLSTDNTGLFATAPAIDAETGDLTFTPAADQFGIATVTVTLSDNGGATNGGSDTSPAQEFTITIDEVLTVDPDVAFITTWKTSSAGESVTIPTGGGTEITDFEFIIDWGDGNVERITGDDPDPSHSYASADTHTVMIQGEFPYMRPEGDGDLDQLATIEQWGDIVWENMNQSFAWARNMTYNATDAPNLENVTDLSFMFFFAEKMDGDFSQWKTLNITNMQSTFSGAGEFNGDITNWNVSNVKNFSSMFLGATSFDQDLTLWEPLKAENMSSMFFGATAFKGDVSTWKTSTVTNMFGMFAEASSFNGNVSGWDVSNVTDFGGMFINASAFDQDLSSWDISSATRLDNGQFGFLAGTNLSQLNYDNLLEGWSQLDAVPSNLSLNVGETKYLFAEGNRQKLIDEHGWTITDGGQAKLFITTWELTTADPTITIPVVGGEEYSDYDFTIDWGDGNREQITGDAPTISHTYSIDQDQDVQIRIFGVFPHMGIPELTFSANPFSKLKTVDQWGDNAWESMKNSFAGSTQLQITATDAPDLSGVSNMSGMFVFSALNSDLSSWDVSNVTDMSAMFAVASSFNQDLRDWDVSNVTDMRSMFSSATSFNQDLSNWDISSVTNVAGMFVNASSFDQNLGTWDISNLITLDGEDFGEEFLKESGLTTVNYDSLLIGWSQLETIPEDLALNVGDVTYTLIADNARQILVDAGWTITDGGLDSKPFVTSWTTTADGESVTIPTSGGSAITDFDFMIAWGDGTVEEFTGDDPDPVHTYAAPGTYQVKITGTFPYMRPSADGELSQLTSIDQWGDIAWENMNQSFAWARNMTYEATDAPDLTNVSDLGAMFFAAEKFDGDLNNWDVSTITYTGFMFDGATAFNGDISSWDVSNVTYMREMFQHADSLNQDLSKWDVSSVTNMFGMFSFADNFNQDVSGWDVSSVTDAGAMFLDAASFDQNLGDWSVEKVTRFDNNNFGFLAGSNLSQQNYDSLLIGWSELTFETENLTLNVGDVTYSIFGSQPRQDLVDSGFEITDGGLSLGELVLETSKAEVGISDDSLSLYLTINGNAVPLDVVSVSWAAEAEDTDQSLEGFSTPVYRENSGYWNLDLEPIKEANPRGINFTIRSETTIPSISEPFLRTVDITMDLPLFYLAENGITVMGPFAENGDTASVMIEGENVLFTKRDRVGLDSLLIADKNNPELSKTVTSGIKDLSSLFKDNLEFNQPIGHWDVSSVENMSNMFSSTENFDQDISGWDVSSVTDMSGMFGASAFNQPIGDWNVSNVKYMHDMFYGNRVFNQEIGNWTVSKVIDMRDMFFGAVSFNKPLNEWDVSSVTDMSGMFVASAFNQPIGDWDVSSVEKMRYMFSNTKNFDQDISGWDVSSVTDMSGMFYGNRVFNQPIGDWNVSNVKYMHNMFFGAVSFNKPLNEWDVSSVKDMYSMFAATRRVNINFTPTKFNQPLDKWDVSNVTDMGWMFASSLFNQDLSSWNMESVTYSNAMFVNARNFNNGFRPQQKSKTVNGVEVMFSLDWDVSNVTNMASMFQGAAAFNQDISTWDVSAVKRFDVSPREEITDVENITTASKATAENASDTLTKPLIDLENLGEDLETEQRQLGNASGQPDASKNKSGNKQKSMAATAAPDSIAGFLVGSGMSSDNASKMFVEWSKLDLQDGASINIGDIELNEEGATAMKTMRETNNMVVAWGGQEGVDDEPVFTALPDPFQVKTEDTRILELWEYVSDEETQDSQLEFKFNIISDSVQTVGFDNTNGELSITAPAYADTFQVAIQVANSENIVAYDTMEVHTNSSFPTSAELMAALPTKMELNQNYPNPFNPTTVIRYGVPQSSKVRLEVFDLLGRKVATLVNNEQLRAGWHQVNFDASRLASGIYLYRIVAGDYVETRKMLLIK